MLGLIFFLTTCPITAINDECSLRAAIELVVDMQGPLRGFDMAETKALLQITADEESHWSMAAVGDSGRARCAMQVWHSAPNTEVECVSIALQKMRESAALCSDEPLAQYAGGCNVPKARRISHHRIAEAKRIAKI